MLLKKDLLKIKSCMHVYILYYMHKWIYVYTSTVDIPLSLHSFKFASHINLHLKRKNFRINNCDFIFRKKITYSTLMTIFICSRVIVDWSFCKMWRRVKKIPYLDLIDQMIDKEIFQLTHINIKVDNTL